MEAHPTLPQCEYFEGMRNIIAELVEQHIAEAPTQDHADNAKEKHVVDVTRMPAREQVLARAIFSENDEEHEADQIHQTIPANRQWSDMESNGIELRMNKHRWRRAEMRKDHFVRICRLYERGKADAE